ncbi:MAG: methylated-DNA-[protein]-cysteine S-methyltransferase [Micromonosporaceae bacterium]|nr:methylated-DNA-[protein]-cysteine S-methyltransferase [Micromonosporaceae bacterium]
MVHSFVQDSFVVDSPIGGLGVAATHDAVCGVSFGATVAEYRFESQADSRFESQAESLAGPMVGHGVLDRARRQLDEYFAGHRTEFDLPLVVRRGSEFERSVWAEIAVIPYGETLSYGAIARAIGEPGGAQAVGLACNRNPLPLVVPCHRVIGSDGKLVGFGGGLDRKRFLLQLEARVHIERTFTAGLS